MVFCVGRIVAGWPGAVALSVAALLAFTAPMAGRSAYGWWRVARAHRRRRFPRTAPAGVANDRTGGGLRYQDGTAIAVVHVLGKYLSPTRLTGAAASETDNLLHTGDIAALLGRHVDVAINSISVIVTGARVRAVGDYARIYDTIIGAPEYAGARETWLIARVNTGANFDGLALRASAGTAQIAAAQRIVNVLRTKGLRAKVGTATDITVLDHKLGGAAALARRNRRWRGVRGPGGWLSTYYYRPEHITATDLARVWSRRADGLTQNITLYADGRCTATVTICSPRPPVMPPSVVLSSLPGEQAAAVAANQPLPAQPVGGKRAVAAGPPRLAIPVASSGVLIGVLPGGERLVLPLTDSDVVTRVHIDADDAILKRIVLRAAAAGERVTIHTADEQRWRLLVMPGIVVTDTTRPAPETTISVVDMAELPAPAPPTLITLAGAAPPAADVTMRQTGPADLEVATAEQTWEQVEVELFEVENSYVEGYIDPGEHGASDAAPTGPIDTTVLQPLAEGSHG
jgi:type VII secretion protein EccE